MNAYRNALLVVAALIVSGSTGCSVIERPSEASQSLTYDNAAILVAIADAQAEVQREAMPDLEIPAGEFETIVPEFNTENPDAEAVVPIQIEIDADELMHRLQQAWESAEPPAAESNGEEMASRPELEIDPDGEVEDALQSYEPTPAPVTHDSAGYLTQPAIEAWLSTHNPRRWSYEGGNSGNALRSHLVNTHGWRPEQVAGLSNDELRELHSASHESMLRPRSQVQIAMAVPEPPKEDDLVPMLDDEDGYWYWTYNGSSYKWHTLEEGLTYGTSRQHFVFTDGLMQPVGAPVASPPATSAPPVRRTTSQPVRISSSSGGCPNGNCGNPRYRGRAFNRRGW